MSKTIPPAGAGSDEVTVKVKVVVPLLPSLCEMSLTVRLGLSSFCIVPTPWLSSTAAPYTLVTLTKKVSFASIDRSPLTVTVKRVGRTSSWNRLRREGSCRIVVVSDGGCVVLCSNVEGHTAGGRRS